MYVIFFLFKKALLQTLFKYFKPYTKIWKDTFESTHLII